MEKSIALLIDTENISASYASIIIDELNKMGTITVRRVYGDWSSDGIRPWKEKIAEYGFTPIQQYAYVKGKNVSDFTLVIDAMDLLYKDKVDTFCIVSSDSDFTKLVTRLKEDNKTVVGMGESKTPLSLVNSFEQFTYLDALKKDAIKQKKVIKEVVKPEETKEALKDKAPKDSISPLEDILDYLKKVLSELEDQGDGWVFWSAAYNLLQKKFPGFNPRNYGRIAKPIEFFKTKSFDFKKDGLVVFIKFQDTAPVAPVAPTENYNLFKPDNEKR